MNTKICFLIDDDDDDREIFETALYEIDNTICCMTATSGVDALRKLKVQENFIPDYIFIDLNMPVVNGKECLSEIKKIKRFQDVPVVMYSTCMREDDIEEARKLGAAGYISKPYDMKQLRSSLKTFFSQHDLNPKTL